MADQHTRRASDVIQIAIIMMAISLIGTVFTTYLALENGQWQSWATVTALGAYFLITVASLIVTRRGQPIWGAYLLIGGIGLVCTLITLFISGLGVILAITTVVITVLTAGQTLPDKQTNQAIVVGIGLAIDILLLEFFLPEYRYPMYQDLQYLVQLLLLGLILGYAYLAIRRFNTFSLRTKLITIFVLLSLAAVGINSIVTTLNTRPTLLRAVGNNLYSLAESEGLALGELLNEEIAKLQLLALNKIIQDEVQSSNAAYTGQPNEIQARLQALDEEWANVGDASPLVFDRLENTVAAELREYQRLSPDHVEMFVTDQYGGLVAATDRPSDFYQGDEEWWQITFDSSRGDVYLSQPRFDESSRFTGLVIAVPIYGHNSTEIVGVLRSTFRLSALTPVLASIHVGETGQAALFMPGNQLFAPESSQIETVDNITAVQLREIPSGGYTLFDREGQWPDSLVAIAPVRTETDHPEIANLDWQLIVYQSQNEALAPVQTQINSTLLTATIIVGVAAIIAVVVAHYLVAPISRLTAVTGQITRGDLTAQAPIETEDEIGSLASAFNSMTDQLRHTFATLEDRVKRRTRRLQTVVAMSQRLTQILDLSDLLREVVNVTKETYDYYHVHIYLLDSLQETLLLAEGYGEAGAEMKRQGHHIPFLATKSLVARAAREGEIITVGNVRQDPNWLPNPLLPETYSEMAIPIMLGREVVGVLDVQSEIINGLEQEDEATLQVLANQVAIAVRNARVFSETQEALYQAQKSQQLYTGEAWTKFSQMRPTTDYEVRQETLPPLAETETPEAQTAIQQRQTINLKRREVISADGDNGHINALATPLRLRDQVIGVLGIHETDSNRQWTAEEIALIESVSEQMSLALENARLFEETGRRAGRERIIGELTRQVWASGHLEEVMQTAIAGLGKTLDASKVVIRLGTQEELPADKDEQTGQEA